MLSQAEEGQAVQATIEELDDLIERLALSVEFGAVGERLMAEEMTVARDAAIEINSATETTPPSEGFPP